MYSKKQIEGMFAYRHLLIKVADKTYLADALLPKSATVDDLPMIFSKGISDETTLFGIDRDGAMTFIGLQYIDGQWSINTKDVTTSIGTVSLSK